MSAPLLPISIAWICGLLLGWVLFPAVWAVCLVGFGSSVLLLMLRRVSWALLIFWCCLGVLRISIWQIHPEQGMRYQVPETPQSVALRGRIVGAPEILEAAYGGRRERLLVVIDHVRTDGQWRSLAGRVQLIREWLEPSLKAGDTILAQGEWSRPFSSGTPGGWDARAALARRRVHAVLRQRSFDPLIRVSVSQTTWFEKTLTAWRGRWSSLLKKSLDSSQTQVLRPLLLGERSALEDSLREALIATGTFHLMVISGFHIGLIALLLGGLGRLLGLPRSIRLLLIALILGAYCLLVGARPPVMRATIMTWMVLGALAWGRMIHWPNLAAGAALLILSFDPVQVFDPGFQLSFGAVASLMLFARGFTSQFSKRLTWVRPSWLRSYLTVNLGCTLAIEVGMGPVLAWYFYRFTPVALVANLLLVPLVSLLVVLGILGLLATGLWAGALPLLAPVFSGCVAAVELCVKELAALPGGWWVIGRPPMWLLIAYYGLLAVSMLRVWLRLSRSRLIGLWVIGVLLWCSSALISRISASRALTVDVLDVGHGDCLVVRPPRGGIWVIDGGTEAAGRRIVVPFLRFGGVRQIDVLWVTHPDEDHLGGAIPILEAFAVRRLLTNGAQDDTMTFRRLMALARKKQVAVETLSVGSFDGAPWGVQVDILHPPDGFVSGTDPAGNENSLVVRITHQGTSFLSTGDIDGAGIPDLLRRFPELRSTVLKVPHHGSALGSFGPEFFEAVHPAVAVISVGHKHGLPARDTLQALESTGAKLLMTRETGALRLRLDGKQVSVRRLRR